jgi:hypothetical protein
MTERTYYDILEVSPNATPQQLKEAYRELIKRYHPDVNRNSAEATSRTQQINQAYSVLRDQVKRWEYDNLIKLKKEPEPSQAESPAYSYATQEAPPPRPPHYECEMCGRQDSTLRATVFIWVISLIYYSYKRGWGHILCSRCRIKYSILFNIELLVLGWWSLYGFIWTLEGLSENLTGGIQPDENNRILLGTLAYEFYSHGKYVEAREALEASIEFSPPTETWQFLKHLEQLAPSQPKYPLKERILRAKPLVHNLAVVFVVILVFVLVGRFGSGRRQTPYYPTEQYNPLVSQNQSEPNSQGSPNSSQSVDVPPPPTGPWTKYNYNGLRKKADTRRIEQRTEPVEETEPENPVKLPLGSSPFGRGIRDGNSTLTVDNGTDADALVRVIRLYGNPKNIRNFYITAGHKFTAEQIPQGSYKLRVAFGLDWNRTSRKFNYRRSFSETEVFEATETIWNEPTDDGYIEHTKASEMSITLHKVLNGNFHTYPINEDDFWRDE